MFITISAQIKPNVNFSSSGVGGDVFNAGLSLVSLARPLFFFLPVPRKSGLASETRERQH